MNRASSIWESSGAWVLYRHVCQAVSRNDLWPMGCCLMVTTLVTQSLRAVTGTDCFCWHPWRVHALAGLQRVFRVLVCGWVFCWGFLFGFLLMGWGVGVGLVPFERNMNKNSPMVNDEIEPVLPMTSHREVGPFLNFHRLWVAVQNPYNPYKTKMNLETKQKLNSSCWRFFLNLI